MFFLGHVVLTWAELFLSASGWTLEAELMDPRRRGDYQGVSELGGTLGRFWAPAVYGFLAMEWGAFGWLTIAAIVTAGAAGLHVAAHSGSPLPRAARAGRRPRRRARRTHPTLDDAAAAGPPSMVDPDAPLPESTGDLIR